jgi:uncharacterized protein
MNVRQKIRIRKFLIILVSLYIAGGLLLYFFQDLILFHPRSLPRDHSFSFDQPFEEVNLPFEGNNLNFVKFKPSAPRKGLVLFYHGNMRNVEHYKKYPAYFVRNGYEVWMVDYPGFGKTTGKRTEENIYRQAEEFYRLAAAEIQHEYLIIYGKSIGTGIASYIASRHPHKKLILETPYYSIDALARHYVPFYPVSPMSRFGFPTYYYLQNLKTPVSILHGSNDETIPFTQAERLQKEKPSIELVRIEQGKHNNLSDFSLFQKKLDSLLAN